MTDQQFTAWLKDDSAVRCLLVEVDVKTAGGSTVTRYLSNKGYVTGSSDTPANTLYASRIVGGIKFTQSISIDGSVSLSFGDIELTNVDGGIDDWLDDFWSNRSIKIFVGDMSWSRADFRQVFSGITTGIDTRKRDRINIKLSDKLQRLNTPVSEAKIGGSGPNADNLIPLCFGECHNVSPVLIDATVNEYQVHNGPIEDIIEVRDNGVPVAFTKFLTIGKFRLTNTPVGVVTASVQGGVYNTNLALYSVAFEATGWARAGLNAPATTATTPPAGVSAARTITASSTSSVEHYFQRAFTPIAAGTTYCASIYVKPSANTWVRLNVFGGSNWYGVDVNLATGESASQVSGGLGLVVSAGAALCDSGWYRVWVSGFPDTSSTTYTMRVSAATGLNGTVFSAANTTTALLVVAGAQFEYGSFPSTYRETGASVVNLYPTTAAEIVKVLATTYGSSNKFAVTDLDVASLLSFDSSNKQPLGVYLSDRSNVLDVCNRLTDSLGSRIIVSPDGLVSIVKLQLPATATGTTVTATDMLDRSLEITQMVNVVASVKVGYCKNWTVQDNLQTGIPSNHADLYGDEWLTVTRTDSTAAANYNLYTDPTMEETLLLTAADAITEANRRLAIFATQRKVMRYTGFYHLIQERVGSFQTIQHSRFGLASGKTGIITSVSMDWMSPKVEIEVLI
jgi:hypothetical protein